MNQWAFVVTAYAITGLGIAGLVAWAAGSMRRAEARLDELTRP
ncbi:MAG: heme exporter protein CcmD [Sphingomicrobium sp.]